MSARCFLRDYIHRQLTLAAQNAGGSERWRLRTLAAQNAPSGKGREKHQFKTGNELRQQFRLWL
ncbi:MAG: hypothetical protein ACUVTH_14310, partial [Thermogutta sp.]